MSGTLMSELAHKTGTKGAEVLNEAEGVVEAFVAGIGNKDSVADIVERGAFEKSLLKRKPRVVWGHDWNHPIGKVLEIREVPAGDPSLPPKMKAANIGGLFARVQFNLLSQKGKEAFNTVAFFGEDQEWSIGYKTIKSDYDPMVKANRLKEVELFEVSPVLHGANNLTGTVSIKADEASSQEGDAYSAPNDAVQFYPTQDSPDTKTDAPVVEQSEFESTLVKDMLSGYDNETEAADRGAQIGCVGTHSDNGKFFPCEDVESLRSAIRGDGKSAEDDSESDLHGKDLIDHITGLVEKAAASSGNELVGMEEFTAALQRVIEGEIKELPLYVQIDDESVDMGAVADGLGLYAVSVKGNRVIFHEDVAEEPMKVAVAEVLSTLGVKSVSVGRQDPAGEVEYN